MIPITNAVMQMAFQTRPAPLLGDLARVVDVLLVRPGFRFLRIALLVIVIPL